MKIFKFLLLIFLLTCSFAFAQESRIEIQWEFPSEHPATSLICNTSGVFAAFADGDVCALSIKDGSVIWKKTVLSDNNIQLAANSDSLYALTGRTLHKLDPATGKVLFKKTLQIPDEKNILANEPVVGKLLIQYPDRTLVVDPNTGRTIFTSDKPIFYDAPNVALSTRKWKDSIDEQRDTGYFVKEQKIVAFNLKNRKIEWEAPAPSELFGAPNSFKELVIGVGPGVLYTVNKKDGSPAWTDNRFDERNALSPNLYFHTPKNRFTMMVDGGFLTHQAVDKRKNFYYLLPEQTRLMFAREHETFFFFIYIEKQSGDWHSIVFRHSTETAQLYGHDDVKGKSQGLFVKTGSYIYPELSLGTLCMLDQFECSVLDKKKLSEKPFIWMDIVGHTAVVATAEGKLVGLFVK